MSVRDFRRVCVYCGSALGERPEFRAATEALARLFLSRGIGLVYGGGGIGLMGAMADVMVAGGGEVIGVIPHGLERREAAHARVRDMRITPDMHRRKAIMAELSDAFISLPGGFGTLEELFECITWAQLGIHRKPIGVLNVAGFFDPLIAMLDSAIGQGFIRSENRLLFTTATEPAELLDAMQRHEPPVVVEWLTPEEI